MIILTTTNSTYYINESTKEMAGGKLPKDNTYILTEIPAIMQGIRNNFHFTNGQMISTFVKSANQVGHLM
ncbi:MAG: hypothetical protein IJ675_04575 [Pseudobutyrivibrio sp.]|nr:hypothetical protein [Pseudobutyrivibrio sp.]